MCPNETDHFHGAKTTKITNQGLADARQSIPKDMLQTIQPLVRIHVGMDSFWDCWDQDLSSKKK